MSSDAASGRLSHAGADQSTMECGGLRGLVPLRLRGSCCLKSRGEAGILFAVFAINISVLRTLRGRWFISIQFSHQAPLMVVESLFLKWAFSDVGAFIAES